MTDREQEARAATAALREVGRRYVRLRRELGEVTGMARVALDALRDAIRDAHTAVGAVAGEAARGEEADMDEVRAHADEAREAVREARQW